MKLKKIIFSSIILIAVNTITVAQFVYAKVAEIEKLKQGTVAIAVSDNEEYNKTVEEMMASVWTTCKYKVIKKADLAAYIKENPINYVISYIELTVTTTKADHTISQIKGSTTSVSSAEMLVIVENRKSAKKPDIKGAMYRSFIDAALYNADPKAELRRELQSMNALFTMPGLVDAQLGFFKMLRDYPTMDAKKITSKELWISGLDADELNMKSVYPYKFKIVDKIDIAAAINEKRKNIAYVAHLVIDDGKQDLYAVHDAETNTILIILSGNGYSFGSAHLQVIKDYATNPPKKKK